MSPQPHEEVLGLSIAGFTARCLHVVADLGVADHIDTAPSPIGALAAACDVDADALDRVLRLLSAHGIFERRPDGYRHTPSSRLLRSDHPQSLRPFARMMGLPVIWGSLTALEHSVRTGRTGLETLEPKGFWAYLQDHPAEADIFGRAMTAKSGAEVAAVLAAYDFTRFATIADIGGGRGHLLRAVLDATPSRQRRPVRPPRGDRHSGRRALTDDHHRGGLLRRRCPLRRRVRPMEILHDW